MRHKGFTFVEVLVGGTITLIIVMITLILYTDCNKISTDQHQFAEIQHSVRSAMYLISKDAANAGVGLLAINSGFAIEGVDGYSPSPGAPDSIKLMGNYENPLSLRIETYQGGAGGRAATAFLYDWELENNPFDSSDYYEDRSVLLISTKCPGCFALNIRNHSLDIYNASK